MPENIPKDSVGIVKPKMIAIDRPLSLESGSSLPRFSISYETYGSLNSRRNNALLICHALSGDQHAAGYHSMEDRKPGWWDSCIGPGKAFDTNRFFVVCPNNIAGCKGSTGPNTINPETGRYYASDFPLVTVGDWVLSQKYFMEALAIDKWAAVIGGSLGGMQAMQWAFDYPDSLDHALLVAATSKLTAQNIAFNEVVRHMIRSDPDFKDGHYYESGPPRKGLMLARMLGHITYLSDTAMHKKFGRDLRTDKLKYSFDVDFEVESYLRYQGSTFVDRFDANTYLYITKMLDYFDPAGRYDGDLAKVFANAKARFLVVSFSTDWRFSPQRSREIVSALLHAGRQVSYAEIEAHHGHDAFLLPIPEYVATLKAYMNNVASQAGI